MRSETTFIMSPKDEDAFLAFVLENENVFVIPQVRNPTNEVPRVRSLDGVSSLHCMLWDREILPKPDVEYIKPCNDYCLRSSESLIQWLRSPIKDETVGAGRIALATSWKGEPDTNPITAPAMTTWYQRLQKWIKSNFVNTFVYASDFVPEVGSPEDRVWVGRDAVVLSIQGWKLKQNGPAEYSLHYYDPAEKEDTLARYRDIRRLIALGNVESVGEVKCRQTGGQIFKVRLAKSIGYDLPMTIYEGRFSTSHPTPRVDDEVACTFQENIFGRVPDPWEARDIKKLTPRSREKTIQSLKKKWLRNS